MNSTKSRTLPFLSYSRGLNGGKGTKITTGRSTFGRKWSVQRLEERLKLNKTGEKTEENKNFRAYKVKLSGKLSDYYITDPSVATAQKKQNLSL